MRAAVEALVGVGIAEAEVRAEVHYAPRDGAEVVDAACGLAVREAREEDIAGRELAEGHEAKPCEAAQVRVGAVRELPRETLRGHLHHLGVRVGQQEAQELAAGVAGTTRDRDPNHPTTSFRYETIRAGMFTPVTSMLFLNSIV